jgi:hypothetical protein
MLQQHFEEDIVKTFKSKTLKDLVTVRGTTPSSMFPDLGPLLKEFAEAFDRDVAFCEQVDRTQQYKTPQTNNTKNHTTNLTNKPTN